jgi:hypothetical protein
VSADDPARPHALTCVEWGREQRDHDRGWRSLLTTDRDEPAGAIVYGPDCAATEFGSERRG